MKRLILRLARTPFSCFFLGWIFSHMAWAIPLERLHESPSLLAFHHPSPSYRLHILIVPKRAYPNLMSLNVDDSVLLHDVFFTVQKLVRQFQLEEGAYRLICNGGTYQDVPLLHFHLISD